MADACLTQRTFWILMGSIWIVGLLGIISTSIAISNTNKLKKKGRTDKGYSTGFLIFMLVTFIVIICGTSIYGVGLFNAGGNPKETSVTKDARKLYTTTRDSLRNTWARTRTAPGRDIELSRI